MPVKKRVSQKLKVTPQVEVRSISFSYNGAVVLDKISFKVHEGDYLGIIGPNGSGKTTLLKILLGLLQPNYGSIKLFGKSSEDFKDRYVIGYVPQRSSQSEFNFPATVSEIVTSGRTPRMGLFKSLTSQDREAIDGAMHTAQIAFFKDHRIDALSGGERQRVFIARALASEPKILILDEPEAGIDLETKKNFYKLLSELNKKENLTIILVSHNIDTVSKQVKSILSLNHRLISHSSVKDFTKEEYLEQLHELAVEPKKFKSFISIKGS